MHGMHYPCLRTATSQKPGSGSRKIRRWFCEYTVWTLEASELDAASPGAPLLKDLQIYGDQHTVHHQTASLRTA